jgi:hypothetical protein
VPAGSTIDPEPIPDPEPSPSPTPEDPKDPKDPKEEEPPRHQPFPKPTSPTYPCDSGDAACFCDWVGTTAASYADPKAECKFYYYCYAGIAEYRACPIGLAFNNRRQFCDSPAQAQCKGSRRGGGAYGPPRGPPANARKGLASKVCQNGSGTFASDKCSGYYMCTDTGSWFFQCQPGQLFNEAMGSCQPKDSVTCAVGNKGNGKGKGKGKGKNTGKSKSKGKGKGKNTGKSKSKGKGKGKNTGKSKGKGKGKAGK